MSENVPPHRREVVVSGDENYFYRAVALWKDEISDEKGNPWVKRYFVEKNPKAFELPLFSSNSWRIFSRKGRSQEVRQKI